MFDNSYFDNSFGFVQQFKNGSFLVHVLVHKKSKLELIEHNLGTGIPISNFQFPISNFQFPISNFQFPIPILTFLLHKKVEIGINRTYQCPDNVRLILISTFDFFRLG